MNMSILKSIRVKLSLILILICIIPISILGLISYHTAFNILKQKLNITSQQTLSEINISLDNYFSVMTSDTYLLSDNFDIKNIVTHPEFMPYAVDILSEIKKVTLTLCELIWEV